jgi:hypothetical protein
MSALLAYVFHLARTTPGQDERSPGAPRRPELASLRR